MHNSWLRSRILLERTDSMSSLLVAGDAGCGWGVGCTGSQKEEEGESQRCSSPQTHQQICVESMRDQSA